MNFDFRYSIEIDDTIEMENGVWIELNICLPYITSHDAKRNKKKREQEEEEEG